MGILVYIQKPRYLSSKIFSSLCFVISIWAVVNYFSLNPIWLESIWWVRIVLFVSIFLIYNFLSFVLSFPGDKIKLSGPYFTLITWWSIVVAGLTLSPYVFSTIDTAGAENIPVPSILMPVFAITIVGFIVFTIILLVKNYLGSDSILRVQWRYILLGFAIMILFLFLSQFIVVVFFKTTFLIQFGAAFILPFIALSAYAIAKHHLMSMKIAATEFFALLLSFILFLNIFVSDSVGEFVLNSLLFVSFAVVGYLLVRSVLQEIAIRKQLEDLTVKLKSANDDLRQLDAAKSEFISIASHQLRTPLSIIKGYVSVMLEGDVGEFKDGQEKYLQRVYDSNERLVLLVDDLLDLSRIESGRMQYKFEVASPFDLTEDIVKEFKSKAEGKKLYLKFNSKKNGIPDISMDKNNLRQAIANIIDNGTRYTEEGGIDVSLATNGTDLVWKIQDTGIGVDPKEKDHLFKKFERGNNVSKKYTEGTGLGLYVARQIIQQHKGKVWVESNGLGKGSTFFISIPVG